MLLNIATVKYEGQPTIAFFLRKQILCLGGVWGCSSTRRPRNDRNILGLMRGSGGPGEADTSSRSEP
jgi:hypothetical protein